MSCEDHGKTHCAICRAKAFAAQDDTIDELRDRLATAERDLEEAERDLEEAQRDAVVETIRRETAERERDEAIAACQQKHGVHPSWVNAVEKMRKERDEAMEQLKVALRMLEVHARAGCPQADEDAARIRGDMR